MKVWDAATGQEILTLKGHTDKVVSVAFSPDGKRLASASWDGTVKVWDAATGQEMLTLKGHTGAVIERGVQPRRQAPRLRRLGRDGEGVGRRDRPARSSPSRGTPARSRAWRSAPTASGSPPPADRTVKVWDAATGQETLTLKGHTGVFSVAFSPDGTRLASAGGILGKSGDGQGLDARPLDDDRQSRAQARVEGAVPPRPGCRHGSA